jgi:hypothetical protein
MNDFLIKDLNRMKELINKIREQSNLEQDQACELLLSYLKIIEKDLNKK